MARFNITTYGFGELAEEYYPDREWEYSSAVRLFNRDLHLTRGLWDALQKQGYKEGDRIFDPMMGSQSSRIAAYKMGFDYVGCELDKEYFDKGCERFNRECKGEIVTRDGHIVKQTSLFDL